MPHTPGAQGPTFRTKQQARGAHSHRSPQARRPEFPTLGERGGSKEAVGRAGPGSVYRRGSRGLPGRGADPE